MNRDASDADDIEPGQDWEVDLFRPEDAEGVVRIFRSVYGAGYPVRTYVESRRLIEENAARRTLSSVARTPRGDIVGHNALFNSACHPGTYESGAGAVHAAYRGGKGIFTRMVDHGLEAAKTFPWVNTVFCEPVCNHVYSQKLTEKAGFVPRALEVDLMPAEAYVKEESAAGRVAAFLCFRTYRPRPHAVHLPAAYRDVFRFLYEGLDDDREFRVSEQGIPAGTASDIRPRVFDFARVARVAVHEVGEDFAAGLEGLEKDLRGKGVLVIQIWLNLACAWVGQAVEILRERGYFLGGALPRWFDDDGLLMQKILKRPDWEGINLYGDRAAEILRLVRADWERSTRL
ncbi:MAG: hypothetical protein JXL84_23345 [Deltaproteobacteria bacterium]|nr:hypothetical protein [Deltaproteobacteria bacterium]